MFWYEMIILAVCGLLVGMGVGWLWDYIESYRKEQKRKKEIEDLINNAVNQINKEGGSK